MRNGRTNAPTTDNVCITETDNEGHKRVQWRNKAKTAITLFRYVDHLIANMLFPQLQKLL